MNLYLPPKKKIQPSECLDSGDSCGCLLFWEILIFLLDLNSKTFTPGVKFFNLTINILLGAFFYLFAHFSVFHSPKGLSDTFKTSKNIILYFERRHLIIDTYSTYFALNYSVRVAIQFLDPTFFLALLHPIKMLIRLTKFTSLKLSNNCLQKLKRVNRLQETQILIVIENNIENKKTVGVEQ